MALTLLVGGLFVNGNVLANGNERNYQIPSQSLNNALIKFAVASDLELLFSADLVRGIVVKGVSGKMTSLQALAQLLKDTGISYRLMGSKTVTLEKASTPNSVIPPAQKSKTQPVIAESKTNKTTHEKVPDILQLKPIQVVGDLLVPEAAYFVEDTSSATKTTTPIKAIPQSIQVIPKALSQDQQAVVMSESLSNSSSVIARNPLYMPVVEGTLIRGFAAEQLIDGFTQYYNPGDRDSAINNEKVEVLKGSNAVMYSGGSGASVGGVINVVSKLPKPKALTEWGVKFGSYNFYQSSLDINAPLHPKAWFRITGEYTNSASHVDVVETQRYNINPSISLINTDSTQLLVQGKISRWKQPDYQGLPAVGTVAGAVKIANQSFIGNPNMPDSDSASDAVWASLEHQFDAIWSVNLKARYSTAEFDEKSQTVFGANFSVDQPLSKPSNWLLVNTELFQKQNELSFQGNAVAKFALGVSKNTLLLGLDHSDLKDQGFIHLDSGIGMVDLLSPVYLSPYQKPRPGTIDSRVKNTSYGGYAQLQSTVFKRLHFLTSLRLGTIITDYRSIASPPTASVTDSTRLLPRVGAVVDVTNNWSVFVNYSQGLRGQPYTRFLSSPEPELSEQLEGGIKFDFPAQLSGQLAVYQIDRTNIAVSDLAHPGYSTALGKQRSQGFEADVLWQPIDGLSILANYAHTDARFMDNLAGVSSGNQRAKVPEHSSRLWANYRFQQQNLKGLSIGAGVYLQSGSYVSDDNLFKVSGFHSFDAAIAYETDRFRLAATVKNFTNEQYFQAYGFLAGHVAPAPGTTVFGSASVKF